MALIVLPHTFADGPGNTASGVQVMDNLNAILAALNGGLDATNLATAAKPLTLMAPFRMIHEATAGFAAASQSGVSGLNYFAGGLVASGAASAFGAVPPALTTFSAGDYAASGLSPRFRISAFVTANDVSPGISFTVGLYPVTAVTGTGGNPTVTLGTLVSGSATSALSPGTGTAPGNSGLFAIPAGSPPWAIGVVLSGTPGANSAGVVYARLEVTYV
jgi:hypothetical protein